MMLPIFLHVVTESPIDLQETGYVVAMVGHHESSVINDSALSEMAPSWGERISEKCPYAEFRGDGPSVFTIRLIAPEAHIRCRSTTDVSLTRLGNSGIVKFPVIPLRDGSLCAELQLLQDGTILGSASLRLNTGRAKCGDPATIH